MQTDEMNTIRRRIDAGEALDATTAEKLLAYAERLRVRLLNAHQAHTDGDRLMLAGCLAEGVR